MDNFRFLTLVIQLKIDKYSKLFENNIKNGAEISQQFAELHTQTLAIHRIQISDLEKVRDVHEIYILISSTKMDDIIHCVADLNAQFNNTLIKEAYEGMKHCINKLTREKGYEYFFREGINEENRNSIVREVSAKMIIFFFGLKKMSSHYFLNSYM